MKIEDLILFIDVYKKGSFARVARDRGIAPSSVSRAVAGLEKALGFTLFYRTTRRLAPTEAGQNYFSRIESLLEDLVQSAEVAGTISKAPRGSLRILAPVSFSLLNLLPILPEFMHLYPEIQLDLLLTDALLDLVENRIDVAIRLGPLSDSSYLARKLSPMRSHVCASPAYLDLFGKPGHPQDLSQHNCLLLDMPGFGSRWYFRKRTGSGATIHVDVSGRLITSNAIAIKQFAVYGIGIILQGEWIVGRELADGTLIDLFPGYETTASYFDNAAWILRPPRLHETAKVRVFLDFLQDRFTSGPPWATP